MARYVLYGGKGGVGKTTCAAATGLALAARGERTLVVSTDPAHSLGDSLGVDLGDDPRRVEPNLWGVEAAPESGQAAYRDVVEVLVAEFREAGLRLDDEDVRRLFDAGFVPGSDEVAALRFLGADADRFERVVFDTAPTGHTLRLLTLPDVLGESLATVGKLRGQLGRLVDSARSLFLGPAAYLGRDRDDEVTALRERMQEAAAVVRDPRRTEFRVVLVPERLAVEETRRLLARLDSLGVPVGSLVVNRVLRDVDECCDRCRARRARQRDHLERVRAEFEHPTRELPELVGEADDRDALERLAAELAE